MRRAQAVRKSRETERRDDGGRCKGWVERLQSQQGRRAADVEEDGRGACCCGCLCCWLRAGLCIASAWTVVCVCESGVCVKACAMRGDGL